VEVPADWTGEIIEARAFFDTGPLAGVLSAREALTLRR
jgi:hypothetical protein